MGTHKPWISPLLKQCFVTTGVSLNMAATGLVIGYGAPLLHQLKEPASDIYIDDSSGSWLASLPGIFMFVGNLCAVPIMGKFGRRSANLASISLLITTWISIVFTPNITLLLVARSLQGICMGMATTLGSLLVGEYTSPRNRGAFLMTVSVSISLGVLSVHTAGTFLTWRTSAMVCSIIALLDLIIVVFSPESPSWLASQGRYEESMRVFRWLRGDGEEDELRKMIEASMAVMESKKLSKVDDHLPISRRLNNGWAFFNETIRKKEFYKPLLIMTHLYVLGMWGGVNILAVYPVIFLEKTAGHEANIPMAILTLDVQRVVTNTIAMYIIKKVRRRVMMFTTVGINVTALLAVAGYSYAKEHSVLPIDHPIIGIVLCHCIMFAIAMGSLSLSFIIAGEIFPLEFKTFASGISVLFYSANLFLAIKSIPFCFGRFGVYGTCLMCAGIVGYCVTVVGSLLPETKDRTLQDIEEEFRGKPLTEQKCVTKSDAKCITSTV